MKTLLLESDPDRRRRLSEALARRGHEVTVVEDAGAARAAVEKEVHPLVFLGVDSLPDAGVDVCRQLRAGPRGRQSILIALTERDDPEYVEKLLAAGVDDCLSPSVVDRLLAKRLTVFEHWATATGRREPADEGADAAGAIRTTEKSVRETSGQFQAIFDGVVDGILIADVDTKRFYLANPMMCRMLGYTPQEIESLGVMDIHPEEDLPHVVEQFARQARGEITLAKDIPFKRKDGSVFYADVNSFPITLGGRERLAGVFRDVTEQKRAEEALRQSEERYRLIAENATDMIWTARIEGINELLEQMDTAAAARGAEELMGRWQFSYISPAVRRLLGYDIDEAIALRLEDVLTKESYREAIEVLAEELAAEEQQFGDPHRQRVLELQHIAQDGSVKWCELTTTFLRDEKGGIAGILGVTRDTTERRQAEAALRQSESALRGLVENMPDEVVVVDREGVIQYINHSASVVPAEKLIGTSSFGYVQPEYQERFKITLQQALQTKQVQQTELCDVFGRWWNGRAVPIVQDGEVANVMVICTDITEQKEAEEAIHQEQELLRQMLDLHERDRELLAFELHDGFVQLLAGAMMSFQAATLLQQTAPEKAEAHFQDGIRLLRESIDESRRLISGLRPPVLEEFGILAAVEHLVGESQALGGQQIEFISKGRFQRLARPLESALFRIVQETLTNARTHSQSDRVRLELSRENDQILIKVQDWGVGFDPGQVSEGSFGIKGIRERARLFGGQAEIRTAPGEGTCVTVRLPLVLRAQDVADGAGQQAETTSSPGEPPEPPVD